MLFLGLLFTLIIYIYIIIIIINVRNKGETRTQVLWMIKETLTITSNNFGYHVIIIIIFTGGNTGAIESVYLHFLLLFNFHNNRNVAYIQK